MKNNNENKAEFWKNFFKGFAISFLATVGIWLLLSILF